MCKKCSKTFHHSCLGQAGRQRNAECVHEAAEVIKSQDDKNYENEEVGTLKTLVKELGSKILFLPKKVKTKFWNKITPC